MFEFLKFLCYITVHLKLYSFVKIDHGGRQSRKNKTKFFSFHFSILENDYINLTFFIVKNNKAKRKRVI